MSVSKPQDHDSAIVVALERAIEALDAELGAVIIDGEVRGSIGFGPRGVPEAFIATVRESDAMQIPEVGKVHVVHGELNKVDGRTSASDSRLIVGRLGEGYAAEEDQMLRGMALVLGLVLHNLQTLQAERSRHRLVESLLEIQRAISAHRPLGDLLDEITAGAAALLDGCRIALLLTNPLTPGALMPASMCGCPDLDEATLAAASEMIAANPAVPDHHASPHQPMLAERVVVGGETAGFLVALPDRPDELHRDQDVRLSARKAILRVYGSCAAAVQMFRGLPLDCTS